jgi:Asp-tRNA(Asn)/Glu-tRNA(Gln) amidotransferase A subunit family amidase
MLPEHSPLALHRQALAEGRATPSSIAEEVIAHANSNAGRNTYIGFDPEAVRRRAETLDPAAPLYAVPISLKDLFDLAGTVTSSGSAFYAGITPPAAQDSAIAASLKQSGALITGKTNLHPLAYGLTGENPDYGDCLQPRDAGLLTGGSSSGAVASVQEGSALAAIGTDTGGSVRIPAALSGLCGFRASHSLPSLWPEAWSGGVPLSPSFDTLGIFTRDPRDLAPIAEVLFHLPQTSPGTRPRRIGCIPASFTSDCAPEVLAAYAAWKQCLAANGAILADFDPAGWSASREIYAAIQASEAAAIHRRHMPQLEASLEPGITQRLHMGAALTEPDLDSLRSRHAHFRAAVAAQLAPFDFLILPSAPLTRLPAGQEYTQARAGILRYTTPFSLAGLPVVTLPGELLDPAFFGTGIQLAAPQLEDSVLLAFSASLRI